MTRPLFLIGTTAFWLMMNSQLIQREFFQLTPIQSSYEVLPIYGFTVREEYQGIYLGDKLIGFNLNVLEKKDHKDDPARFDYELRQNTYMTFLFLGEEREMLVKSKALLDSRLELQSFEMKFTSGDQWTDIKGQINRDILNLIMESKEGQPIRKIIPVQRPLFFSESLNMIWTPENLRPGKQGKVHLWNPLLLSFEDLEFRVGPKTKIVHEGKETEVYELHLTQQGFDTRYWCTPEGVVLRHESPTGLMMIKQDGWKIFDTLREERGKLADLPNLYSIPSNRILERPEELHKLKVKLQSSEGEKILTLEKPALEPFRNIPLPLPQEILSSLTQPEGDSARFLEATEFIQSGDPLLTEEARKAAGPEPKALAAALSLMQWTHRWVTPAPTASIPSALQVYKTRKGDCNEYTALYTALARSLGIPAKMVAGVVYQNGRFFYHAWPEIFLGQWIAIDPTFNQAPADVTHIPLAEGDLNEQVQLIQKVGKMKLVIINAE